MNLYTEIAFLLDSSGSMDSITEETIATFNGFLLSQKNLTDDQGGAMPARFSLVTFDTSAKTIAHRLDLREVLALNETTYQPSGGTALLDALGDLIDSIGSSLAAMPEQERPAKVIVAILTDGEENSSTRFSLRDINQRIAHQTQVYQWEFLYLGADHDAIAAAAAVPGTVVHRLVQLSRRQRAAGEVSFGHPSGLTAVRAEASLEAGHWQIRRVALSRSARVLMEGFVRVPGDSF